MWADGLNLSVHKTPHFERKFAIYPSKSLMTFLVIDHNNDIYKKNVQITFFSRFTPMTFYQ